MEKIGPALIIVQIRIVALVFIHNEYRCSHYSVDTQRKTLKYKLPRTNQITETQLEGWSKITAIHKVRYTPITAIKQVEWKDNNANRSQFHERVFYQKKSIQKTITKLIDSNNTEKENSENNDKAHR